MQAKRTSYGSKPASPAKAAGTGAPYNLTVSVGDELVRLTGLFENKSKAGNDYLGVKKIRKEDADRLIEVLQNASDGTEIGFYVFENKSHQA